MSCHAPATLSSPRTGCGFTSPEGRGKEAGFSLVELSIVLVILGLLVGGILVGQSLIRAAELRSLVTDFERYQNAVITFRDKYYDLPGDMAAATDFWGEAGTGTACQTTEGTGTQTCNGNSDGKITNNTALNGIEVMRAWQHLANAGLVEGTFSGVSRTPGTGLAHDAVPGKSTPTSKIYNVTWAFWYGWNPIEGFSGRYLAGDPSWFEGIYNNMFILGGQYPSPGSPVVGFLSTQEGWSIDDKIDDGGPATGRIVIFKSTSPIGTNCATTDSVATSGWNLSNETARCFLIFRQLF
jgi:prepilin-type N-terminal cleavage/methylation domain-containing protein